MLLNLSTEESYHFYSWGPMFVDYHDNILLVLVDIISFVALPCKTPHYFVKRSRGHTFVGKS